MAKTIERIKLEKDAGVLAVGLGCRVRKNQLTTNQKALFYRILSGVHPWNEEKTTGDHLDQFNDMELASLVRRLAKLGTDVKEVVLNTKSK